MLLCRVALGACHAHVCTHQQRCELRNGMTGGLNCKGSQGNNGPGGVALRSVPANTPSRKQLIDDLGGAYAQHSMPTIGLPLPLPPSYLPCPSFHLSLSLFTTYDHILVSFLRYVCPPRPMSLLDFFLAYSPCFSLIPCVSLLLVANP